MSRTSAPVLMSLLLLLLLLQPRDSAAAATNSQLESKSCKTLDEVLLEKYVTRKRRSSSDDASENVTPLPSGSTDFNWLALYLLLQDQADQLCHKTLYIHLNKRYSGGMDEESSNRQDNATTTAVPKTESEDQQASNVTLSSTAQKGNIWINMSTTITYDNDESSGKFFGLSSKEDSASTYYDSSSLTTTLPGNFNQTFTIASNEESGNNSNETLARDNEDESDKNEAIHARSKENFLASVYRDKEQQFNQDDDIVKKIFEVEGEIVDGDVSKSHSKKIDHVTDGNSSIDEHDQHDQLVDKFWANVNENSSRSNATSNVESREKLDDENNSTTSEHDQFVDDFFANEDKDFSDNGSKSDAESDDKFVDDFFASDNENLSENEMRRSKTSGNHKKMLDENNNNDTVSEHDKIVDDFFASENEHLTNNGIGSEGPNKDSEGTLDDKANNDKTASSEFNLTKSHGDISSSSSDEELTPSMEGFIAAFSNEVENVTNWEELTNSTENENSTMSEEVPLTKTADEFFASSEEANFTLSEMAEIVDFFNNSSDNFSSNATEIPDPSEFIPSQEFLEVAISEEKNAMAAQLWTYSNETATLANGTEDRFAKYPDTGDGDKAGHTTLSVFKETTYTTTTTTAGSDDWSSTIVSIESPNTASEAAVQRRRRNILMTFREASAGKLRAPEATSSRLVDEEDDSDAWESSDSLNTPASSRNRLPRIITAEMNKGNAEPQRQYRTFLLGFQSRQTQFAENRDSRSQASAKVKQ